MTLRNGLFLCCLFFSIAAYSQRNGNPNDSFVSLIESYSQTSGIQFAYNPDQFSKIEVDDTAEIKSEEQLLKVLSSSNIEYRKIDNSRWLLKVARAIEMAPIEGKTFTGKVMEGPDEPLVSALIFTEGAEFASLTDDNGDFVLNIPNANDYKICCQYLGYEVQCIDSRNLKENSISFDLKPKFVKIDGVKIRSKRVKFRIEPIQDGEEMVISGSDVSNAVLGKDVLRTAQLLSGVDATNDMSSALRVRSASGLQSLITLDNIPIYHPESAFGIFSVLNPLVVSKSTLYKNVLPLEFGEFTGGYLACTGTDKVEDKFRMNLDLSNLTSNLSLKIPIGERSQITGAFRITNGNVSNTQFYAKLQSRRENGPQLNQAFNRPLLLDTELENTFRDLYLNFIHKGKNNWEFKATFFANNDLSGSSFNRKDTIILENNVMRFVEESMDQTRLKRNTGISLSYEKTYRSDNKLSVLFYSSRFFMSDQLDANITFRQGSAQKVNTYESDIKNFFLDSDLKIQYASDPKRRFNWKIGVDGRRLNTGFNFTTNQDTIFKQYLEVPTIVPYLGLGLNFNDVFRINFGNRSSVYNGLNRIIFSSPRISSSLKIHEGFYLKSSISHNEQFFRPADIERQLGQSVTVSVVPTGQIPLLKSNQATIGYSFTNGKFRLNSDFYLRYTNGIAQQVLNIPGLSDNDEQVFDNNDYEYIKGDNRVVGIDMSAFYEIEKFNGLVSYTLSRSQDRFNTLFDNRFLPTQNNRLHQVNLFGNYKYEKWSFSGTYIYGSGVYTLNRTEIVNLDRPNINPTDLFKQLPAYKRLDLGVSREFNLKRYGNLYMDLNIFNFTNNKNINSEIYIYQTDVNDRRGLGAAEVLLLNRTINLGVRYVL